MRRAKKSLKTAIRGNFPDTPTLPGIERDDPAIFRLVNLPAGSKLMNIAPDRAELASTDTEDENPGNDRGQPKTRS